MDKRKVVVALLLLGALLGYALWRSRENIPSDGDGALDVRIELNEAQDLNLAIEDRVREAKGAAGRIAESIDRNGELADQAEAVITDCQRILGEIRSRGTEN